MFGLVMNLDCLTTKLFQILETCWAFDDENMIFYIKMFVVGDHSVNHLDMHIEESQWQDSRRNKVRI